MSLTAIAQSPHPQQLAMFNARLEPLVEEQLAHQHPPDQKYSADRPLYRGWFAAWNFAIQVAAPEQQVDCAGNYRWQTIFVAEASSAGPLELADYAHQCALCRAEGARQALLGGGYYLGESIWDEGSFIRKPNKPKGKGRRRNHFQSFRR